LQICREITAGLGINPSLALAIAARSGGPLFEVNDLDCSFLRKFSTPSINSMKPVN